MRNCPGPERIFFCILIIDHIFRRALVFFSLLRAINYHYNKKGFLKVISLSAKQFTEDCHILPFNSQYRYSELSKLFLFLLPQDTPEEVHSRLLSIDPQWFSYFIYVLYLNVIYLCFSRKYQICGILNSFCHNFFAAVKKSINFDLDQQHNSQNTKFLLSQHRDNWKTEKCQGAANRGKVDLDSNVNRLASGNLRQYTNVPSQWEILPWTWMWHLLYFDCWSHFNKRTGIF